MGASIYERNTLYLKGEITKTFCNINKFKNKRPKENKIKKEMKIKSIYYTLYELIALKTIYI